MRARLILAILTLATASVNGQAVRIFDRLDKDLDVSIVTPTNGQLLQYNGTKWVNATVPSGTGTVTSIAITGLNGIGVAGSPITTNGTITLSLSGYVASNTAVTGATKTKITFDSKGLVTAGANATTADIAASTDKQYVSDADLVKLANLSGTNTGDQDLSGYQTKAGTLALAGFSSITGQVGSGNVPTLNQNTTGSAASLSISGQTGLLTVTGLTSTNRIKTVRDAADTILELGGSYTPTGTWNFATATLSLKNGQQIFDGSHVLAIDGGGRKLYGNNGTTIVIDWTSPTEVDFFDGAIALNTTDGWVGAAFSNVSFIKDAGFVISALTNNRQLIANDGSTVALDWSNPSEVAIGQIHIGLGGDIGFNVLNSETTATKLIDQTGSNAKFQSDDTSTYFDNSGFHGSGASLTGVSASTVTGVTDGSNAAAGKVGEYISASRVVGSATALTTATPKTVTSISLTAGDWDVTAIGALTGASTGTEFDVAIGTTTNSFTGTVLGDTRCQTPTVSITGADASLMIPAARISIASTTTYYLIVQETFTIGSPSAYGRISARRVR